MRSFTCFTQLKHGTAGHDFTAVQDKGFEHVLEVKDLRLAVDQRHHVDAEHALHLGLRVEVVKHNLGHFATAPFDGARKVVRSARANDFVIYPELKHLFVEEDVRALLICDYAFSQAGTGS